MPIIWFEDMEGELYCCKSSKGWTREIAWFQMISSFISTITMAYFLVAPLAVLAGAADDGEKNPDSTPYTPEEIQTLKTAALVGVVGCIIFMILGILAFVMAIILLCGSIKKNPRLIHAWIVYTVILLSIWVVWTIIEGCFSASSGAELVTLAFGLGIDIFCMCMVMTHMKEIEASAGRIPVNRLG